MMTVREPRNSDLGSEMRKQASRCPLLSHPVPPLKSAGRALLNSLKGELNKAGHGSRDLHAQAKRIVHTSTAARGRRRASIGQS